jgi:hypothetical protein
MAGRRLPLLVPLAASFLAFPMHMPLDLEMATRLAGAAAPADLPESSVASRRAMVLTRALSYDATLADRAGRTIVLLVLYKRRHGDSEKCADVAGRAFKQIESLRIAGAPFRRLVVPYAADLEQTVETTAADVVFLCDGLEGDLAAIKQVTRKKKVLTIGTTETQVRAGVSLGLVAEGTKMTIVVNWTQCREEGATFGSDLLRLARVIR